MSEIISKNEKNGVAKAAPQTCAEVLKPLLSKKIINGEMLQILSDDISAGKNELQQLFTQENFVFDTSWVDTILSALFSIEKIAKAPKTGIAEERNVVPVEKAKRTGADTVRHLASNTANIRGFNDDGSVRPSKVLNTELIEDKFIYENRFVYTLIKKLAYFLDSRVNAIKANFGTHVTSHVYHNSQFKLNKSEISYNLQIKVRRPNDSGADADSARAMLDAVIDLKKRVDMLQMTDFYRVLARHNRLVSSPVMKTNLLGMNVDYKNCYKLWLFLQSYTEVGFGVEVKDKDIPVDTSYFSDLVLICALSVKAMLENDVVREPVRRKTAFNEKSKRYKIVSKLSYSPSSFGSYLDNENAVNQFYFDKIRALVKKTANAAKTVESEKKLDITFTSFYRTLADINNKLFEDVLDLTATKPEENAETSDTPAPSSAKSVQIEKLKKKAAAQKERIGKLKKLTKLMAQSAKAQQTKETKEIAKLKKMESSLKDLLFKEKQERAKQAAGTSQSGKAGKAASQSPKAKKSKTAKTSAKPSAKTAKVTAAAIPESMPETAAESE